MIPSVKSMANRQECWVRFFRSAHQSMAASLLWVQASSFWSLDYNPWRVGICGTSQAMKWGLSETVSLASPWEALRWTEHLAMFFLQILAPSGYFWLLLAAVCYLCPLFATFGCFGCIWLLFGCFWVFGVLLENFGYYWLLLVILATFCYFWVVRFFWLILGSFDKFLLFLAGF